MSTNDSERGITVIWALLIGGAGVSSLLSTIAGLLDVAKPEKDSSPLMKGLFAVGAPILLTFVVVGVYYLLRNWQGHLDADQVWAWGAGDRANWYLVGGGGALLFGAANGGKWLLNRLTLLDLYRPRIRRTWMSGECDPRVSELGSPESPLKAVKDLAPYPIINCAMNMAGSTGPATLDRKAENFTIAPYYSGSALTSWFETSKRLRGMKVSEAAAISGSAFSPNIGMFTAPLFSVLLTLFNARLGKWIKHPQGFFRLQELKDRPLKDTMRLSRRSTRHPRNFFFRGLQIPGRLVRQSASYMFLYWRDMFGAASHEDGFVFLSDGGHFENTGVYELLRRRCKYIVFVNASGENPRPDRFHFSPNPPKDVLGDSP